MLTVGAELIVKHTRVFHTIYFLRFQLSQCLNNLNHASKDDDSDNRCRSTVNYPSRQTKLSTNELLFYYYLKILIGKAFPDK